MCDWDIYDNKGVSNAARRNAFKLHVMLVDYDYFSVFLSRYSEETGAF